MGFHWKKSTKVGAALAILSIQPAGAEWGGGTGVEVAANERRRAVEAAVATAKARFMIDHPEREGGEASFQEILPYLRISGGAVASVEDLEKLAGAELISLGQYVPMGGVQWGGAPSASDDNHGEEANVYDLEGEDFGIVLPPVLTNPPRTRLGGGQSFRKILYSEGRPVQVKTYTYHPGGIAESKFLATPREEEVIRLREIHQAMPQVEQLIPSVSQQIAEVTPDGEDWGMAQLVTLMWRGEDGSRRSVDVVRSVGWPQVGEKRGRRYSQDVEALVNFWGYLKEN